MQQCIFDYLSPEIIVLSSSCCVVAELTDNTNKFLKVRFLTLGIIKLKPRPDS
jgi:hypothetical protein